MGQEQIKSQQLLSVLIRGLALAVQQHRMLRYCLSEDEMKGQGIATSAPDLIDSVDLHTLFNRLGPTALSDATSPSSSSSSMLLPVIPLFAGFPQSQQQQLPFFSSSPPVRGGGRTLFEQLHGMDLRLQYACSRIRFSTSLLSQNAYGARSRRACASASPISAPPSQMFPLFSMPSQLPVFAPSGFQNAMMYGSAYPSQLDTVSAMQAELSRLMAEYVMCSSNCVLFVALLQEGPLVEISCRRSQIL